MSMGHDLSEDLRGLCCAEPIIRINNAIKTMQRGQVLLIVSDKISMLKDVAAFCRQTGNTLLQQTEKDGVLEFWIRRG